MTNWPTGWCCEPGRTGTWVGLFTTLNCTSPSKRVQLPTTYEFLEAGILYLCKETFDLVIEVTNEECASITGDSEGAVLVVPSSFFDGSTNPDEVYITLAHELIHATQLMDGDLDLSRCTWLGKSFQGIPYHLQGHEVEAYQDELTVAIEIIRSMI